MIRPNDVLANDICGGTVFDIPDSIYGEMRNVNLQKFFSKYSILAIMVKICQNFTENHLIYSFAH